MKRTVLYNTRENICGKKFRRELLDHEGLPFQRNFHVTDNLISRLGLQVELQGHTGCVNCLEWNETGSLLASGSDDVHLIVWDPFLQKQLISLPTGHTGNIFSVKFLPNSNDSTVVTGAADCRIKVHDLNVKETTHVFDCHEGRIKRLATVPNIPFLFWSASEDGTIMQFDLRSPESANSEHPNNVLINLNAHLGAHAEAKCLATNPLRPELLAVGANDPYVRLYDRRMLTCRSIQWHRDNNAYNQRSLWSRHDNDDLDDSIHNSDFYSLPEGCVQYFVAAHLPQKSGDYKKRYRSLAATYVTFSPDGAELLVNIGGEQVYLFDINKKRRLQKVVLSNMDVPTSKNGILKDGLQNGFGKSANGLTNGLSKSLKDINVQKVASEIITDVKTLPPQVDALKKEANRFFQDQDFKKAVMLYNTAITLCPSAAILYSNRAAALMKRNWDGDTYAALRDCHMAIKMDPNNLKAHFRLAKCLYELSWPQEALECLLEFKAKFPNQAKTQSCELLGNDIQKAIDKISEETVKKSENVESESADRHTWRRNSRIKMSEFEIQLRENAYDYERRFCGHCNTTTDIKEANYLGCNGQYIVAGSDDGSFFIWDKQSTNIMRILRGDDAIVNCLQCHPSCCLLATSGIDPVVRLWSPRGEDGKGEEREVVDQDDAALANQRRMNADPLEVMLSNMGYRISSFLENERQENEQEAGPHIAQCRAS